MKLLKYFFFLPASLALLVTACNTTATNSAETSGNWVTRSDASFSGRSESISFIIGGLVYVGTGYDNYASDYPGINKKYYNYGRTNDLFVFDQSSNNGYGSWKQLSSMANATDTAAVRSSAVAFATSTKGYVATGFDGQYRLQDNWEYDPIANSWLRKKPLPDNNSTLLGSGARYDAIGFAIGDTGYVVAGKGNRDMNDLWQYIPATDSWFSKTSMGGSGRTAGTCFVYNHKAYVLTGTNNGSELHDFWYYDPNVDSWTKLRDIANTSTETYDDDYTDIIRDNAVSFVLGDYAYLSTGQNGSYTAKTWVYDIKNDLWTRKTPFERNLRGGAIGFTVGGRCFVALGSASGSYFNGVEEFKPSEAYNSND